MNIEVNGVIITLTEKQLAEIDTHRSKQVKQTPEELFKELIKNIDMNKPVVDFEKYPNHIFWFDGEEWMFEYDFKNHFFWINYTKIWQKFKSHFDGEHSKIKDFMNSAVEEHFNLKGVITIQGSLEQFQKVEEHFNLKGVITNWYKFRDI